MHSPLGLRPLLVFFALEFALVAIVYALGQTWQLFAIVSGVLFVCVWIYDNHGKMGPTQLIAIGVGGAAVFLCLAVAGLIWQSRATQPIPMPGAMMAEARRLSQEQKNIIADALRKSGWQPNSVWLRYANGCEECRRYMADFKSASALTGADLDFGYTLDEADDQISGLKLHVSDLKAKPPTAVILAAALERAGVDFEWSPWPPIGKDQTILFAYRQKTQ
jgi:hypothetical protein